MAKEQRFDPLKEIQNIGEQIGKQIEKGIRTVTNSPEQIILDVYEADNQLTIRTNAIDGLVKNSIEVSLENGILTIAVQTEPEATPPSATYHVQERRFGRLSRSVELTIPVKANEAKAKVDNGSIIVTLPVDDNIYGNIKVTPVD
jgi:HSP20 family protein